ncbi:MAG: hypothetical protein M3Q91_09900 [Acidobacteriota bacterium]|nr:hypothetical protein [Acidobacteriota bacterium]
MKKESKLCDSNLYSFQPVKLDVIKLYLKRYRLTGRLSQAPPTSDASDGEEKHTSLVIKRTR